MDTRAEVRWRLRNGRRIVGYERHISGRVWSSADGLWWSGQRLDYTDKDRGMCCRDINNQWLFEGDVVMWDEHSGQWRLACIGGQWLLIQGEWTIPAPQAPRILRRVAFAFPED